MRKIILLSIFTLFIFTSILAQKSLLQSGPMVGYAEKQEVLLWVQTKKSAEVKFKYWPVAQTQKAQWSSTVKTIKDNSFTAKLILDKVTPSTSYKYELYINNKKVTLEYDLTFGGF